MTESINHPWAVSEKLAKRYGPIWAKTDFRLANLVEYQLKENIMESEVGVLHVGNTKIRMKYKHLISESTKLSNVLDVAFMQRTKTKVQVPVTIGNREFQLYKHEITKVLETLEDALEAIHKTYQLGLYL